MATTGYETLKEFQKAEVMVAPALKTEGKVLQREQHIGMGRKVGVDTVGFLMMAHMIEPEALLKQAKLMEGYGAQTVYITDSAGYMLPDDVTARIAISTPGT